MQNMGITKNDSPKIANLYRESELYVKHYEKDVVFGPKIVYNSIPQDLV